MDLTVVAIQAALRSGEILKKGFGTSYEISLKPGNQNLVTAFDKASEETIMETIFHHFPNDGILAEESGSKPNSSPVLWIIDPLDGTVNFANNIPIFSISIAACIDNEVICGVIYQPIAGELFVAEKGKGAYLNGNLIHVSSKTSFERAILATGFPYNVDEDPLHCIETFAKMTQLGVPIRRMGSAAIDLAYVAAGRFDAYWEVSLQPWDLAAGKLLVEEAGGKVTHYDGSRRDVFSKDTILATNSYLHSLMQEQITS